ncbi:uncharacterized protein A1O9_09202 [Exophiala aquamarina CBS 119918]|uniref:UBA domain-containing protein n=1 Tax=Exophiala aquamarina CBS 119918 TaxID=1182545 RepID=A0A072PGX3_9EURO|nr:uncharacterized protein A1O9_09202 [Exophiala aquamarina CBS 119918]KEF54760.1 hypothetical protein A1O9_09202 [Exophiala aquamarina CBS 119918]
MDDIAGLKWTSTPVSNAQKPAPSTSNYSAFASLKPTPPTSGRASPLFQPPSQPASKPGTPANDSFANLVGFNTSAASNKNLSLQEQQKRLLESKLKQQQAQSQKTQTQYAAGDDQFWNNLGSGRGTPATERKEQSATNTAAGNGVNDDEDDLFAAFNRPAPIPKAPASAPSTKATTNNEEEDDPFELSAFANRRTNTVETTTTVDDDDDVLGLLGKPTSARLRRRSPSMVTKEERNSDHPQDKAVAELVDMGFPADKARQALETTESGLDVQAAVGFLLNQAHSEAQAKARSKISIRHGESVEGGARGSNRPDSQPNPSRRRPDEHEKPRTRERDQARGQEKDFEQMATEFGSTFLKTANSFWKQSTKRVQQAVQEFNSDGEANGAPKWMRETERQAAHPQLPRTRRLEEEHEHIRPQRRVAEEQRTPQATDEALMLESSRPTPPPRSARETPQERPVGDSELDRSRDHSPAILSRLRDSTQPPKPAFLGQQNPSPPVNPRTTLNRHAAEEQAAQAYVSSARRRKPQPPAPTQPPVPLGDDLLEGGFKDTCTPPPPARSTPALSSSRPPSQPIRRTETPVRAPAPQRNIPSVSPISLKAVHSHREKGNEHFKRGDYSAAHQSYATSITHLPETHPLIIVLLTNRSLTALKVGEPKNAIADADKAIAVIGVSKGESETIDFGTGDLPKPMRDYYGKALMRKAEALEQMEKWMEAAVVWREAVEAGHGGATAIQGRARAEKAATPRPAPNSKPNATRKPAPAAAAASMNRAAAASKKVSAQAQAAAISRLRAANAAADKADDERFQLGDRVDARIQAWKGGKEGNLRALLGSLENALWEGSGWKKISMADLVLPGKVKIQYMKGIAKVHPDKIPTDATTEQRMIAGAVFSALNEAWDKFKAENGL